MLDWQNFNRNDGLLSDQVYSSAMDVEGRLWFGCKQPDGLICRDSGEWKYFTTGDSGIPSGHIWDLAADPRGGIWCGTAGGGLTYFDGTNWTVYTRENGLAGDHVYAVAFDSEGRLWCGCAPPPDTIIPQGGISIFDGQRFENLTSDYTQGIQVGGGNSGLCDNRVYAIAFDDTGRAWMGTKGGGICRYDGTSWAVYNKSNGLPVNEVGDGAAAPCGTDGVWFGLRGGGLAKYTEGRWIFHNRAGGLAGDFVYAIAKGPDENWWVGCSPDPDKHEFGGGISRLHDNHIINYTSDFAGGKHIGGGNSPLADNRVYTIVFDSEGNGWFGTKGSGISRLSAGSILKGT